MRIFKVSDGTSWTARVHDGESPGDEPTGGAVLNERIGWEAIVFEATPASVAQRLVYRPAGWLVDASPAELAAALEEGVTVRLRWGADG